MEERARARLLHLGHENGEALLALDLHDRLDRVDRHEQDAIARGRARREHGLHGHGPVLRLVLPNTQA